MRPRVLEFAIDQADATKFPLMSVAIFTPAGARLYSSIGLLDDERWFPEFAIADGSWQADGTVQAGAQLVQIIAIQPRVVSFGTIQEQASLWPSLGLTADRTRQISGVDIVLRNDDDHFGKLLQYEVLLSSRVSIAIGWRGLPGGSGMRRYEGIVDQHDLTREICTLRTTAA